MKVQDRIVVTDQTRYYLDGEETTEAKYRERYPLREYDGPQVCRSGDAHFTDIETGQRKRCWPIVSNALKLHVKRRQEAIDHAIKNGVPTDFTSCGQPILRNPEHQRAYFKIRGVHHNNGTSG